MIIVAKYKDDPVAIRSLKNKIRTYEAASRRPDRSLEAKYRSALRASDFHEELYGRRLVVTLEIVENGDHYVPDLDYRPSQAAQQSALNLLALATASNPPAAQSQQTAMPVFSQPAGATVFAEGHVWTAQAPVDPVAQPLVAPVAQAPVAQQTQAQGPQEHQVWVPRSPLLAPFPGFVPTGQDLPLLPEPDLPDETSSRWFQNSLGSGLLLTSEACDALDSFRDSQESETSRSSSLLSVFDNSSLETRRSSQSSIEPGWPAPPQECGEDALNEYDYRILFGEVVNPEMCGPDSGFF
ncbi:hypothetical protein FQN54_009471 [Arachnomyces sp. PD_36]|nr:hypothetical protein FQN54_009471 [Arachnomyces sp. PD_36]